MFTADVKVNTTENLVLPDSFLRYPVNDLDTLVSIICRRIDGLSANSEKLRGGLQGLETTLVADLGKLDCQFSLLRGTLGSDPGISDVPFRNPWEGIVFLKDSLDINRPYNVSRSEKCAPLIQISDTRPNSR